MKYLSVFAKMSYLFNSINNFYIYPIFLGIFIVLLLIMLTKKVNNNKIIVLMIINYLLLFILTISNHYRSLSKVFDSIVTNLFKDIYFPSTQVYLFIMVVIDVITITTMFNKKKEKAYKISNGICFFTSKFILALILDTVGQNKIDIFEKKSLFSNTNLVVLLEISVGIFILWLLSLIVIYVTNLIAGRIVLQTDKEVVDVIDNNDNLGIEVSNDYVDDDISSNVVLEDTPYIESPTINNTQYIEEPIVNDYTLETSIYDNINENENEELNFASDNINIMDDNFSLDELTINIMDDLEEPVNIAVEEPKVDSNILLDRLINNGLPLIESDVEEKELSKNSYTLNDYKTFNRMLKEIRDMNNSNIINIDNRLDLRLKLRYSEEEYNLFKTMIKNYSN